MGSDHGIKNVGIVSYRISIILLCLILLVSCAYPYPVAQGSPDAAPILSSSTDKPDSYTVSPPTDSPTVSIPQTSEVTASPQVTAGTDDNPTHSPTNNIPTQYKLDALLDYNQHTLSVTETVSYVNNLPDALTDLMLVIEPNRRQGGFSLVSLTWEDGESVENYDLQGDQMRIPLPQPLVSGDRLSLIIRYLLEIPEIAKPSETNRPQPYGYTTRQTNIVDWYPYIPPYRPGEGWLVHKNWWFGEHQVFDIAEFQVKLTLAEPVQDLIIAASAPAEQDGDSYRYYLDAARSFALSASNEYLLQSTTVGDVTIYSYSFPYDKYSGQEVLHNTADAVQLYSQLIMPYPHSSLSVVEADFLDGMEYDGLYFLSHGFYNLYDGTPKGYLTFIAAHETAHQWWYGLVGNDQALEPWLDEALCTYMEHIFYENIYADYPTGSDQSLVDWWWYYRVNFYDPVGWVDSTIYDFNQFLLYRNAVYLNGAKFLDAIRNQVGDEVFFTFLRDYARSNKYEIASAADFFAILREKTSLDLNGSIKEYFQSPK